MQIHEITYKKRVDEGFMDAMKGIGSVAAQGMNQALGTNIGGAGATAKVAPGVGAQTASVQAAQTLSPKIAAQQNDLWSQSLQAMMANQQVQSLKQLDKGDLAAALNNQINRVLDTNDWRQSLSNVDARAFGGSGKQAAEKVNSYMETAIRNLLSSAASSNILDSNLQTKNFENWKQIANMVIQIQNMQQFNKQQAGSGGTLVSTPQQASSILNRAGVRGPSLTGLQSVMNSLGPIPTGTLSNTQRSLLKAIGAQIK